MPATLSARGRSIMKSTILVPTTRRVLYAEPREIVQDPVRKAEGGSGVTARWASTHAERFFRPGLTSAGEANHPLEDVENGAVTLWGRVQYHKKL